MTDGFSGFEVGNPARPQEGPTDPFTAALNRLERYYRQYDILNEKWQSVATAEDQANLLPWLIANGYAADTVQVDALGNPRSAWDIFDGVIRDTEARIDRGVEALYGLDSTRADIAIGGRLTDKQRKGMLPAASVFQPAPYQFDVLPNGDVLSYNPNNGQVKKIGSYPDAVQKSLQQDRNGNLIAIDPYTGAQKTLIEGFGFPEIDPAAKFRFEVLNAAAQTEQAFAGLELQRRGQILNVIGDDFARQVEIGSMVYAEAQQRLDTVDRAYEVRRQERDTMLRFAVSRSSLRTNAAGETVTRLEFADQLSSILSSATGREFRPEQFELGVTAVNPDVAAQDVVRAGSFTSPIPGLLSGLEATRAAMNQVLGQPTGNMTASNAITQMALPPGVS